MNRKQAGQRGNKSYNFRLKEGYGMDVDGSGLDGTCLEGANQRPKRVLLKLSGEVLTLPGQSGINIEETLKAAAQIKLLVELGVQPAVVVGGGNILRGAQFSSGTTVIKKLWKAWGARRACKPPFGWRALPSLSSADARCATLKKAVL